MSTYVHLTPDNLREETYRVAFGPVPPRSSQRSRRRSPAPSLPGCYRKPRAAHRRGSPTGDLHTFPALGAERDIGFEPTTFSLGMRSRGIGWGSQRSLGVASERFC